MRKLVLLLAALAGAAVVTAAWPRGEAARLLANPAAAPSAGLALASDRRGGTLLRVDAQLRATDGRRLAVGRHTSGWSYSPDGTRLALGSDETAELLLVDVARLRVAGRVVLAGGGTVVASAWLGPRRVVAVVSGMTGSTAVVAVDPVARRVLARTRVELRVQRAVPTADGLVLLLAPLDRIGPAQLALVRPSGGLDVIPLPDVLAGSDQPRRPSEPLVRIREPGLAVDPVGGHAYVLPTGSRLVDVDLRTRRVVSRRLSEPISLLGRIGRWLEPDAQAKSIAGPARTARWLGGGLIAIGGLDYAEGRSTPAGLRLVDVRRGTVRTIDPLADRAFPVGDLLLATGAAWSGGARSQTIGLRAYGLDGRLRFELFRGRTAYVEHADAQRAYVHLDGSSTQIVELATGRVLGTRARLPVPLPRAGASMLG